jgi:polyhydroxybutyrate depolymerase
MRRILALVFALTGASGCDSHALHVGGDLGSGGDGGAPASDLASATTAGCGQPAPIQPDSMWTLHFGGLDRLVRVHVPTSYDPQKPTAVVLDFHGFTSNGDQEILLNGMNTKADAEGFISVHPDGTGTSLSWNAGACCGEAVQNMVDDVGFVGQIIDTLEAKLCVDANRVFATGMSNGGFLSHRLACELSDRIAAIAPVAGVLGIPTCKPSRAVPVMGFHGTADMLVPYAGSTALGFPPVPDTYAAWAMRDGCDPTSMQTFTNMDSHCQTWSSCHAGAEVILCTVDGGGHTWPGGTPIPTGYTTPYLNATDAMWTFFTRHAKPN